MTAKLDSAKFEELATSLNAVATEFKEALEESASIASQFEGSNTIMDSIVEGFRITENSFNDNIDLFNNFNSLVGDYFPALKEKLDKLDVNETVAAKATVHIAKKTAADLPNF